MSSSLAQQLAGVAQASQTLALDRKKRSKLHSVSLIYESQHAATQDYDTIYTEAFDALEKLETLDRRFGKFKLTIFSETSINIDRQVQSKEQNDNLDKTINVFLSLLSPYWHLAVSIKAAEWLVRRFQMHVYNSEVLLLSTLPYFDQPVFERVLYVIPKMPTMFQWLTGFKKANNRLPSKNSVVKAFTDVSFFNLYSKHIIEELQHKNQHRRQLVFFVAMTISTLASLSANSSSAFADYVPLVLEVSGSLLVSKDQESKISAYTILAVLSTAVPLSRDVVLASIDTILLYSDKATFIQALTCVLRLYQSIQSGSLEPLPLSTLNKLPKDLLTKDSDLLALIKSSPVNNKFVCSYIKALIVNDTSISISDLSALEDLQLSHGQLANILIVAITKINSNSSSPTDLVPVLKFVIAQDKQVFINVLKHMNVEIYALEMKIQTTLFTEEEDLIEAGLANNIIENKDEDEDEDAVMIDAPADEEFEEKISQIKVSYSSFLHATKEIDETFHKLVEVYLRSMQLNKTSDFLSHCFSADSAEISFLLRVATSINTPFKGRTYALKLLNNKVEKLENKYLVYPILPILCTLLINSNLQIRNNANIVIQTMNKRPTNGKTLLLADVMYGEKSSSEVAMLSPKDGNNLLSIIASFSQYVKLDQNQFHANFTKVVAEKKLGKITLAFFASNAIMINIPSVKIEFMEIVRKGASAIKGAALPSQLFESFLSKYVEKRQVWFNRCQETGFNFDKFESQVVSLISLKEDNENGIEFLEEALNCSELGLVEQTSKRIIKILPTLKSEYQVRIVKNIIDNGLGEQYSKQVYYDPVDILESVELSNNVFVQVLEKSILHQASTAQPNVPKRRRRSSASTRQAMKEQGISTLATTHLKKTTVLLEVLDKATSPNKSNGNQTFKASFELLKILFQILDDLETLGKDGKLAILYTQETLASCLRNVIDILKESNTAIEDSSSIRADIVVSVIRSSESPQVQNKLLLVIASLASLSPELVLHSVMPIFTFMGAHTIRQDDEFSGHVVEQTILCVVPALIKSVDMVTEIEVVIASFVTAFQHIPRHRRVRLFTTLAKTLNSEYYVHLILFLCGQQYATSFAKHKMGDCAALTDFSSSFLQNFHPEEQLDAIRKYLKLWSSTPDDLSDKDSAAYSLVASRAIFADILMFNKSQLFNLRKCLISFIRQTITGNKASNGVPRLRLKIASMIFQGEEDEALIEAFGEVIEIILKIIDNSVVNTEDEEIVNEFYKLLGDVIVLLPIEEFVKSVTDILTVKDVKNVSESQIRVMRHITVLTSSKFDLEHIDDIFAHEGITKLIPILLKNIELQIDTELSQASLDTLSKLIERFNERIDAASMINALKLIVTDAGLLNKQSELIVSSIGCIARIVNVIGVKMIGFFPLIVPPLLKIFEESQASINKKDENSDDSDDEDDEIEDSNVYEAAKLVQTSIIVLFSCLIKKIPSFVTPNLSDILKLIVDAQIVSESVRSSILNVIVEYIDPKTLLATLCSIWTYVSTKSASSIGLFLNTLDSTIDTADKKIIISQASMFVRFLLNALEYRGVSTFDNNTISRVESSISKCGISFVMKLNDKSFRPLFASIVRWAFDGEGVITPIPETERLKSFFKFYNKLQENLRSIITSYFSYLLDSTEQLLARFTSGELDDINLRRLIFISLASSFKYDQDEYWLSSSRFAPISKSLCDQLINVEDQIGKYLVKAVTGLVHDCASSDEHNRSMNDLLIKHMKADCKPREKYWAVKTLESIYKKNGENWMSLLPQLVPIIAELLEDDDEDVEMEVRTGLVKVVEEVMGEPLDRYLD